MSSGASSGGHCRSVGRLRTDAPPSCAAMRPGPAPHGSTDDGHARQQCRFSTLPPNAHPLPSLPGPWRRPTSVEGPSVLRRPLLPSRAARLARRRPPTPTTFLQLDAGAEPPLDLPALHQAFAAPRHRSETAPVTAAALAALGHRPHVDPVAVGPRPPALVARGHPRHAAVPARGAQPEARRGRRRRRRRLRPGRGRRRVARRRPRRGRPSGLGRGCAQAVDAPAFVRGEQEGHAVRRRRLPLSSASPAC